MKKIILLICGAFFITLATAQTGNIKVKVNGLKSDEGTAKLGLYNSKDDYPAENKAWKKGSAKITNGEALFTYKDIPEGTYVLIVFHDVNDNAKFDKNFIGMPKEKFGFSQNIYGKMGAPDFDDIAFTVEEEKTTELTITIK